MAASLASLVTDIFDTFGIEYDPEQYKNGLAQKSTAKNTIENSQDLAEKSKAVDKLEKKVEEMEKNESIQQKHTSVNACIFQTHVD